MKAIETLYKGYKFRSRLEARWAVFFDNAGISYLYEPQGFVLRDGTNYLPDFYLNELKTWVEVKGVLDSKSAHKIELFAEDLPDDQRLWVVSDIPNPDDVAEVNSWFYRAGGCMWDMHFNNGFDQPYLPCVCPVCQKVGIEFDGRGARVCDHGIGDKSYSSGHPILVDAYRRARQARFEYGQEG